MWMRARPSPGTLTKLSPISAERPRPKSVSASPDATWLATKTSVSSAKSDAIAMPARIAASRPSTGIAGGVAGDEADDGADRHHAFDAEVQDAGTLRHQFAERREEERHRGGDDGEDQALELKHSHASPPRPSPTARGRRPDDAHAVENQRVAGEHEEEQQALEDARDLVRDAVGDLHALAAEIGERQHEAGEDDAERIQPAEEGDDDRGEAVARRDADAQLPERSRDLADAGETREAAGDQEGERGPCGCG